MGIDTKSIDFFEIINNASIGLMICNGDEVIYSNQYIYKLLGYNENDNLDLEEICHPYFYPDFHEFLKQVDKQDTEKNIDLKLLHKEGSFIPVQVTVTPYWIDNELVAQVLLHDRSQKASSTSLLDQTDLAIGATITEVILELNLDGEINDVHPSISSLCGYHAEVVVQKNLLDFIHDEDKTKFIRILENVSESKDPIICRFRLSKDEGGYIWVESRVKAFYEKDQKQLIVSLRNISEEMETEQLLKQSEKLAVIGELSAGVVHEIKNPLTSIKGFLQLMQAGAIETTDYITILNTEIERIEKIANDLLSFARPSDEMIVHDINQTLDEVIFLIEMQAKKKDINICWNNPEHQYMIMGNKSQLKQVFINLIKNGIEASEEGSKIEMYVEKQGDFVSIHIKDYGCGIPKNKLDKVGDSFFTTKEKGTGLGLMVTHRIINNHQGTISVKSEEGKGTTFSVRLPLVSNSN